MDLLKGASFRAVALILGVGLMLLAVVEKITVATTSLALPGTLWIRIPFGLFGLFLVVLAATEPLFSNAERKALKRDPSDKKLVGAQSPRLLSMSRQAESAPTLVFRQMICTWTFNDDDSGVTEQIVKGLELPEPTVNLTLPFHDDANCPGAKLLRPSAEPLEGSPFAVRVEDGSLLVSDNLVRGKLLISGHLRRVNENLSYVIRTPFAKMFAHSRDEADRAYISDLWKQEVAAMTVTYPTLHLRIEVRFPPRYAAATVTPTPVVFFGHSETEIQLVTERLRQDPKDFAYLNRVAILEVREPQVGFRYGISFMPPI
jgi:hypothetical protein